MYEMNDRSEQGISDFVTGGYKSVKQRPIPSLSNAKNGKAGGALELTPSNFYSAINDPRVLFYSTFLISSRELLLVSLLLGALTVNG